MLVLAADQFTKYLAIENLPPEEPVHILGDFLIFYLIRNSGAAFSLGEGFTWIFTIAMSVVALAIIWLMLTRIRSRTWAIVLGLLLGGVLGNLTDRLFREPAFGVGHVIDFINTPWMMPAIYNIADIFIVTMMIAVAILVLIGLRFDGTREERAGADTTDDTLLGAGGDEVPPGGGATGGLASPFPTADPQAGVPVDERGLPPVATAGTSEPDDDSDARARRPRD